MRNLSKYIANREKHAYKSMYSCTYEYITCINYKKIIRLGFSKSDDAFVITVEKCLYSLTFNNSFYIDYNLHHNHLGNLNLILRENNGEIIPEILLDYRSWRTNIIIGLRFDDTISLYLKYNQKIVNNIYDTTIKDIYNTLMSKNWHYLTEILCTFLT
jgi:hypothetical protein